MSEASAATATVLLASTVQVGGQAVLGRQDASPTPWLTERHGYDPTCQVSRTVVLLRPSPVKDASRRSRRVVRSFCCDRHRPIGFNGALSAFNSRLALRVLLGRHRSCRAICTGTRFPTFAVRQVCHDSLPRSHGQPSRALSLRSAPANEPSPLRRSAHGNQLLPDVPSSGYRRPRPGFLTLSAP